MNKQLERSLSKFFMRFNSFVIVALALVLLCPALQAADVEGLFEASVPVMTQDAAERKLAIEMGLIDVLIKNTGQLQIATRPDIHALLVDSEALVSQYVYRTAADEASAMTPLYLNMIFDSGAIRARLTELSLPYWPAARQPILVWLVVENAEGRRLVGSTDPQTRTWREQMVRQASRRGMSLIFPDLDEQDWATVQIGDVWDINDAPIRAASKRYQTNQILVGALAMDQVHRWRFTADFDRQAWSDAAIKPNQSVAAAIDRVMTSMSSYFAVRPDAEQQNRVALLFTGINQPVRYAQLQTFLMSQPTVTKLTLLAQKDDQTLFEATLASRPEVLFSALLNATFLSELSAAESADLRSSSLSSLATDRSLKRYRYTEGK